MGTALRKQLVYVFDNYYLSPLKNTYMGYSARSIMEIIKDIYSNYTWISATDMVMKKSHLQSPCNKENLLKS